MHSEEEAYRGTLVARTADGERHTLIVTRRHTGNPARVWLTLHGAWKTTVQLTDRGRPARRTARPGTAEVAGLAGE